MLTSIKCFDYTDKFQHKQDIQAVVRHYRMRRNIWQLHLFNTIRMRNQDHSDLHVILSAWIIHNNCLSLVSLNTCVLIAPFHFTHLL